MNDVDNSRFWLYFWRVVRLISVVAIIIISFLLFFYVAKYTYPFLIALGIAFLMNPFVNLLENRGKMPRPLAVFISITVILAGIIGIISLLVVELIDGTNYLANQLPQHFKSLVAYIENLIASQIIPFYERLTSIVKTLDPSQQQEILNQIKNVGANIADKGANILQGILKWIPKQLGKLPNLATVLIFSLLGTFFISKDWYRLGRKAKEFSPGKVIESSKSIFQGLQKALFGFMKAQFTLISITAITVLIGLLILRVDYAITIAVITGAVDLLPYLGTGFVFVPWIIYMFFTGNYFLTIGLSILYIVVIIQRQFLEPKVLSTNIGLDPLATLISLFVGYQMFSFLGLIIGPAFLVIINTLHQTGVFQEIWTFIMGRKST